MRWRKLIRAMEVAGALMMIAGVAEAADAKYPDWKGAWERWYPPNAVLDPGNGIYTAGGQPSFDQTKPWGRGQEAPLTPEYQKVYEESLADQAKGGEGNFFDHGVRCMPGGMPLMTIAFTPLEFVITPEITYVLTGNVEPNRRIYTDGRDWPKDLTPTYAGYSIGRWIDEDSDGVYDVLEVETHGDKKYRHNPRYRWTESSCIETNSMVAIGKESYFMSADGMLMPVRKNQPPPDLRYFKESTK